MDLENYLKKAQKNKWAVGQFNFSTLEQLRGILSAAKNLKSPVILGTSEGESGFLGLEEIIAIVEISKMKYSVSAFLNLDHGKDVKYIKKAIDLGYQAVHFDGSDLPFKENIKKTKEVVKYAHRKGVLAEGELGRITGGSEIHKNKLIIKEKDLTPPELVFQFVKETGVDSLAVAVGTAHGVYKGKPKIDFERLAKIRKLTDVFLVLHGGSGIFAKSIEKSIRYGIVKININTELRVVWKNSFKKMGSEIKPYKILPKVEKAIEKKVEEKIKLFGSKNKI